MNQELKQGILVFLAVIVITIAISWVSMGNEFFLYKVFAPKQEAVRREVYENTNSYNRGMAQDLVNMEAQYIVATDEQKLALGSLILRRVADYDETKLKKETRAFISQVRNDQTNLKLKSK